MLDTVHELSVEIYGVLSKNYGVAIFFSCHSSSTGRMWIDHIFHWMVSPSYDNKTLCRIIYEAGRLSIVC